MHGLADMKRGKIIKSYNPSKSSQWNRQQALKFFDIHKKYFTRFSKKVQIFSEGVLFSMISTTDIVLENATYRESHYKEQLWIIACVAIKNRNQEKPIESRISRGML